MKNEPWKWQTTQERVTENAISLSTAALYGVALTQVFNPVALGIATAYGAGVSAYAYYSMHRKDALQKWADAGYTLSKEQAPEIEELQELVNEFTEAADMTPHTAALVTDKFVSKTLPWGLQWAAPTPTPSRIMKIPDIRNKIMGATAATLTTMDVVLTTKDFLREQTPESVRFAIAHEVGHAKVEDSYKLHAIAKIVKKLTSKALYAGLAVSAGAAIFGLKLPIAAAGTSFWNAVTGAGLLFAAGFVANKGLNAASRIQERRADRNAVYLTRDAGAGIGFLDNVIDKPREKSSLLEWAAHPSYFPRVKNLRKSYEVASEYPPLATATDEQTPVKPFSPSSLGNW